MLDELTIYNLTIKYPNTVDLIREVEKMAYNKAIDDYLQEIVQEYDNDASPNVSDYMDYELSLRQLDEIAEQLKAGGNNEQ